MEHRDTPYRFYGAEISYFSAKVRPALRYKGLTLAGTGCEQLLAYAPRHRLEKRGFTLAFATT